MITHAIACPYKGLMPYEEEDAPFFFGREAEQQIITSNLLASRLTLLYGASAVGKSSVLQAGVMPQLHRLMQRNLEETREPEFLALVFRSWSDEPTRALIAEINKQLETQVGRQALVTATDFLPDIEEEVPHSLRALLHQAGKRVGGNVLIIFDQFEEYFQYHASDGLLDGFGEELAAIARDIRVPVNFLFSIREDALAKLDAFKGLIPNLFDNYLRMEFIDRQEAEDAIRKPLAQYNQLFALHNTISIENKLVEEILRQVSTSGEDVSTSEEGAAVKRGDKDLKVETPYLQLVLTKLWKQEIESGSTVLRLDTFRVALGGAKHIVSSHLNDIMADLTKNERDAAADIFRFLVSRSGTKFAQSIADLADYSGRPAAELEPLLVKLSDEDRRILRPVAPPLERKELKRYEIFHDVLAASVLAWTRDYRLEREKQALAAAHIKTLWRASGYVVLLAGFLVYWGYTKYIKVWKEGRPWAYVSSVSSGNNFQLTGYSSTMGRSVEGYLNTVDIRPQNVSRLHFMIYNTGVAVDLRSLNGTTVNGEFLPYGDTRTLNEGDVIALAGAAAYKFHWIEYGSIPLVSPPMLQEPPPQGWGLFIDGTSRRVTTLTGARYFVSKGDNGLTLDDQNSGDALAVLEWHDPGLSIQDMPDINALYFQAKENDYDYPFYTVPSGLSVGNLKTYQENHDLFEVVFSYDENNRFQIIPVDHNVERLQESE